MNSSGETNNPETNEKQTVRKGVREMAATDAMLKEGSERARAKAAETLRDVRHAMQIDYFG